MSKINIRWEIEDGYVSGGRPQSFIAPIDEFEDCETEQDVRDAIDDMVRHEFENKVSFYCKNESEIVEAVMAALSAKEKS